MLKDKSELISFLEKRCGTIVFKPELCETIREYMFDKYKIPTGTTMDMIARGILSNQTEFVLFCLVDGIDYATKTKHKTDFFTEIEINQYSTEQLSTDIIKFPLKIKCDQVAPDQWIGVADTYFFMELRKAQLIRYNTNAQRVMKRIIKGENILFKLIPNKMAIHSIRALMQKKMYIPTVITLNIPYYSNAKFYFDSKARELVITELDAFDISDGYHRYLAMCEESDENQQFNYPMEIRIVNFTDEKTRQFIFQEDQKTKMAKDSSNAMNNNRPSNIVIDQLNEMMTFEFKGQIGINKGTIDYIALSNIIEYFYFSERKKYTNIDIRNVRDEVKEKLNALAEYNATYITKTFDTKELALVFYVFNKEKNMMKACQIIDETLKSNLLDNIRNRKVSRTLFNAIEQLV